MKKIGTWVRENGDAIKVSIPGWIAEVGGKKVGYTAIFGGHSKNAFSLFDIEKYMLTEERTHVKLTKTTPNGNKGDVMELS
jgi:hypothetical protein